MKLALIGTGNMPLMQWILDGTNDDTIINMSALARRLGCSRSSPMNRVEPVADWSWIRPDTWLLYSALTGIQ